ncbi:MAG: Gluconate 5-dehydrogenase [Alphaproteobacteria bacterium MarineAlpha2_Bin1]|mgnify:CR=1 FL=1|nr:MAG: Gluconate 5-dehydrogenase [Alphaproteobacteria bacterium MarineAlpha2_Bin1]
MIDLPKIPSFRLDGKRAVVVGASSGIGLGCAVALASAGASVTIVSRRINLLSNIVNSINQKGWRSDSQKLDITDVVEINNFFEIQETFDIAVFSAGIAKHTIAIETNENDYDNVMSVNTKGAYFFAQAFAERLISQNSPGSLIFISSQMSKVGGPERAVYSGSKHALEGFQKSMATEWGPYGIRVNSICPTFIQTPLTESTFSNKERLRWIKEKIKLGRVGEVEDIMGAVIFLASESSSLITGTSIVIDGGWTSS